MKSISENFLSHIKSEVTSLATCWKIIRKDEKVLCFTDHSENLEFEGNIYKAGAGYSRTAISNNSGLSVDNLDITGVFDSEDITEQDLRAGLFDDAEVFVFLVNRADLSMGSLPLRRGSFGEVTLIDGGVFQTELRGLTQLLSKSIGELYTPECRADLGDDRCKMPIIPNEITRSTYYEAGEIVRVRTTQISVNETSVADFENRHYKCTQSGTSSENQPSYSIEIGTETADGECIFIAEQAWQRSGQVTAVTNRSNIVVSIEEPRADEDWFTGGLLIFESGQNKGKASEVKSYNPDSKELQLFLPQPYSINIDDRFSITPGCSKCLTTCQSKFANVINFRGEPYLPGQDELLNYPDAK